MTRWLAPLLGVAGLVVLVVGITWAEWDNATMAGVDLVGLGALGLLLAAAVVGLHEGVWALLRRRRVVAGYDRPARR